MSTTTDDIKTTLKGIGREAVRLTVLVLGALTIGIIGTLILEPFSTAHYAFVAILMIVTAIAA